MLWCIGSGVHLSWDQLLFLPLQLINHRLTAVISKNKVNNQLASIDCNKNLNNYVKHIVVIKLVLVVGDDES